MNCPYCQSTELRYSVCKTGAQCKKCGMRFDIEEKKDGDKHG